MYATDEKNTKKDRKVAFDSSALNGLRGFAAIHILLYHSLLFSTWGFHNYGNVQMPLYFLLSGFCITLGYGKAHYDSSTLGCGPCKAVSGCDCHPCSRTLTWSQNVFDSLDFYIRRLTKILPVYYFCFIIAVILIPLGHGPYAPQNILLNSVGSVSSIFLIQSWIMLGLFAPNAAAWTVSTLFFFYLVYPSLLVFAQRRSNSMLATLMVVSFYFQLIISGFIFLVPLDFLKIDSLQIEAVRYWLATAHPIVRLPVFFMGICAGVLCIRIQQGDLDAFQRFGRWSKNILFSFIEDAIFPFPFCQKDDETSIVTDKSWRRRVDLNMMFYMILLLFLTTMNIIYNSLSTVEAGKQDEKCQMFMEENGDWSWNSQEIIIKSNTELIECPWWATCEDGKYFSTACRIFTNPDYPSGPLQIILCYLQLMIIVGLCLDQGKSWVCQFFKTRLMQFLGRISMSLYLIHEPLVYWLKLIIHGQVAWIDGKKPGIKLPLWGIPIHLLISFIFGALITLYIEDPARNFLKKKLDKRRERQKQLQSEITAISKSVTQYV